MPVNDDIKAGILAAREEWLRRAKRLSEAQSSMPAAAWWAERRELFKLATHGQFADPPKDAPSGILSRSLGPFLIRHRTAYSTLRDFVAAGRSFGEEVTARQREFEQHEGTYLSFAKPQRHPKTKQKLPTDREKKFLRAIQQGLRGAQFIRAIVSYGVSHPPDWQSNQQWREARSRERYRITRKFPELARPPLTSPNLTGK